MSAGATGVVTKNKQLTRVYGTSFPNKRFNRIPSIIEEAKRRDEN
jgi:phosphotransferase system IIB component